MFCLASKKAVWIQGEKVIHKLSTFLSEIGGQPSFPGSPVSVTMKWGKVGSFGDVVDRVGEMGDVWQELLLLENLSAEREL